MGLILPCKAINSLIELLSAAPSAHTESEAVPESWRPLTPQLCSSSSIKNLSFISAEDQLSASKSLSQGEDSSKHQHSYWVTKLLFLPCRQGLGLKTEAENLLWNNNSKKVFDCTESQTSLLIGLIPPSVPFNFISTLLPFCWAYPFLFLACSTNRSLHCCSCAYTLLVFICCYHPFLVLFSSSLSPSFFHSHLPLIHSPPTTANTCLQRQCTIFRRTP